MICFIIPKIFWTNNNCVGISGCGFMSSLGITEGYDMDGHRYARFRWNKNDGPITRWPTMYEP